MAAIFRVRPSDVLAEIGPSAGPQSYEVSESIADEFAALGLPRNGRLLDLWGANRLQLERAGVPPSQITTTGHCTISDPRYFSHRRDASGCRNLAITVV
jgi:copper oxidase (laccase) domain-containing protein